MKLVPAGKVPVPPVAVPCPLTELVVSADAPAGQPLAVGMVLQEVKITLPPGVCLLFTAGVTLAVNMATAPDVVGPGSGACMRTALVFSVTPSLWPTGLGWSRLL